MIGKLVLVLLLAGTIRAWPQVFDIFSGDAVYEGPFLPNGCPTDFEVHWLLPHETECNKFYYCNFGELVERTCDAGTYFNPKALPGPTCDWPERVDCGDRTPPTDSTSTEGPTTESPTTESPTTESPTTEGTTTESTSTTPEILPNGCPANFSVHQLLPHETYCNMFYYCVFGEKVERYCAPGTYFNPDADPGPVCDWPDKVDCAGRPTAPPPTESSPAPTDGTTTDDTTSTTPEILPNGCPANFSIHQLLPHETYCNKFYYCVFGEKVERDCPPGTYFNPNADPGPVCDWPDKVDCGGRPTAPPPTESSPAPTDGTTAPTPTAPTEDLVNGCPADFDVHRLLPHEYDCNRFYYCVHGEKVERQCPPGLHFNPDVYPGPVCDWPENVDCESRPTESTPAPTTAPPPPPTTPEPTTAPPPPPTTPEPTTAPPPPPTTPEPTPPTTCPPPPICPTCPTDPPPVTCDGCDSWAHETDCDKFWRCVDGRPVLITCSEGLHFNAETKTCDFICYANCVRTHVQATAHWEGLQIFLPWDQVDDDLRHTYQIQ